MERHHPPLVPIPLDNLKTPTALSGANGSNRAPAFMTQPSKSTLQQFRSPQQKNGLVMRSTGHWEHWRDNRTPI